MRTLSIRVLASWLCLATALPMGVAPAQDLMLCVGFDGHVDLSPSSSGDCVECPGEAERPPDLDETGLNPDSTCCPCVDLPIASGGDVARQPLPRLTLEFSDLLAASLPVFISPARVTALDLHPGAPPPCAASFATSHLRSVVLLV